ncbi:hypothetical protein CPB86DRAFT_875258 [Serendipita vermifera]|nr:hypothetical protein CPB86DRAFT_875258 [Serendipita vermifera]
MSSVLITGDSTKDIPNAHPTVYSAVFPAGYGEFILKSSGNVILHFPLFLLTHTSPVFRDMCKLPNSSDGGSVALTEDGRTLEYLLSLVDPAKYNPDLDWEVIEYVLAAADKYQIETVLPWFEREVTLEGCRSSPSAIEEPMLCLALATRYKLPEVVDMALRQLIRSPVEEVRKEVAIGEYLSKYIMNMRGIRTSQLIDAVLVLGQRYDEGHCEIHKEFFLWWARALIARLALEPNSSIIFAGLKENQFDLCTCPASPASSEWKEDILAKETILPNWKKALS